MSWIVAWLLWTGCAPDPFVCTVQEAYTASGQPDPANYRVNTDCLKGVSARLKACYGQTP